MSSLADACRDGSVDYTSVVNIIEQIETDEHNPYGGIDDVDKFGESALRWCASHGRDDLIELLIKRNANVNCLNDLNQTPLHAVCWNQHTASCTILLSSGAEIDAKDRDGCTSLHKAAWKGNKDICLFLIQAGATVDAEDSNGATPLHYASVQGHEAIVSMLLARGAKVQHLDKKSISAIQRATTSGRLEVVKLLLNKNANIEATDSQGLSLLHRVSVKGYYNIAEELLRRGANFRARDRNGATPLHKAAAGGNLQIIKLLLRNGDDIQSDDSSGATCIHKAAWAGQVSVLAWLLENGSHIERKDKILATPLQYSCWNNQREALKFLIDQGANVNNKDSRGNTPLIDACTKGHSDIVELLVAHKANLLQTNKSGCSPLMEAIRMQKQEVVRFLLHRFGMEALGGPEVWQNSLKLAKQTKNEAIFQLIVRANSTEIIRENIHKNLKIVHQQYESLRDTLGKAEYLCALLDRHGFYGKSKTVMTFIEDVEPLLQKLLDGIDDPQDCSDEQVYDSKDYKEAQTKLHELIEIYNEELTIGSPFPEEDSVVVESLLLKSGLDTPTSSRSNSESTEESNEQDSSADESGKELSAAQLAKRREKILARFKRKETLHKEIEKNIDAAVTKMKTQFPSASDVPELNVAIDHFNVWKAKVTAEVVESVRRIDTLSRQLHESLISGYKLMETQGNEGKLLIAQLLHATLEDKKSQVSTSEKVEQCRSYKKHLQVLLARAEEREEKLLQIELEERKRRDEQSRMEQEKRLMASPRKHMSEEEALRIAEMEVEKYKRKQEYSPTELRRLEVLKEKLRLQKEKEDKEAQEMASSDFRVEFPDTALDALASPKLSNSVLEPDEESPFHVPQTKKEIAEDAETSDERESRN